MDSTGTGNMGAYGGEGGEKDKCDRAFSADLDDVGTSDYYTKNRGTPSVNSQVSVGMHTAGGHSRPAAFDDKRVLLGYLPVEFNYLVKCLKSFKYEGLVTHATKKPVPAITIDVQPTKR
jgi:hypothetical protein